jgi:dipeptidase E
MAKLYLLGGENIRKRSAQAVNEAAFADAGQPLHVLVFSWARASFDRHYSRRKMLTDYFTNLGADTVDFVEYSDPQGLITQKIAESNLIYLTGGLVNALVERLKSAHVDKMLRNYPGVIIGRSAGALALCRRCVVTKRFGKKAKMVDGLGLADLTLKAHYRRDKDEVLKNLSIGQRIYAVPSRSALIYMDGAYSSIGKIFVFENGQKRILKSLP